MSPDIRFPWASTCKPHARPGWQSLRSTLTRRPEPDSPLRKRPEKDLRRPAGRPPRPATRKERAISDTSTKEFAQEYQLPRKSARRFRLLVWLVVIALVGTAGFFLWQRNQALESRLAAMGQEMAELRTTTQQAEARAEVAELSAIDAASRAESAAERADEAEQKTLEAEARAEAERQEKLKAWKEQEASREAQQKAEEERAKANEEAYQARLDAKLAQLQTRDAEIEIERLKDERERALQRLQSTLSKFAETRRSKLGLVMNLGDSIEFDFDKTELRPQNRELLSRIAGVLMTLEDFNIQVFGHTDDIGGGDYNLMLSHQRAAAVRDYLVEAGIEGEIISTRGFGKTQPLVQGVSAEARQRNRRVEIAVVHVSGELAGLSSDDSSD